MKRSRRDTGRPVRHTPAARPRKREPSDVQANVPPYWLALCRALESSSCSRPPCLFGGSAAPSGQSRFPSGCPSFPRHSGLPGCGSALAGDTGFLGDGHDFLSRVFLADGCPGLLRCGRAVSTGFGGCALSSSMEHTHYSSALRIRSCAISVHKLSVGYVACHAKHLNSLYSCVYIAPDKTAEVSQFLERLVGAEGFGALYLGITSQIRLPQVCH